MVTNKELAEELSKYKELVKKFEDKMQDLEKRIKKVEDENKELKEEISGLNKNSSDRPLFNNWVTAVVNGSKEKPKEKPREQHLVLNAVAKEQTEHKKREKNLVIFGTKATKTELDEIVKENKSLVSDILTILGKSDIQPAYIRRLKSKKDDGTGPIIVEFKEIHERNEVLRSTKILRTTEGYKEIFINPDLTESERLMDLELRKKRKELNDQLKSDSPFRYGIRGNELVKIKKQ